MSSELEPADDGRDAETERADRPSSTPAPEMAPETDALDSTSGTVDHEDVAAGRDGPRASTVISITAVAFAVGAVVIDATLALPGVLLAAVGVTVAVLRREQTILGLSTALGLVSVLAHGALGGGPLGAVLAAGLFVFAWDQVDHALELDAHLGTDATVFRGELAHAAYSLLVVAFAGGGAYALALVASGRRPLPALVLLLLGAILLVAAIRDR